MKHPKNQKTTGRLAPNVTGKRSKKSSLPEEHSDRALPVNGNLEELNDDSRESDQELDVEVVKELTDDELQKELKRFLIPKLRSASYRWKFRSQAIKDARIARGLYECAICKTHMKNGEFKADHVEPVVALEGWESGDWTTYIKRMFVGPSGFQIICDTCHTIKSDTEVQIRKLHREKKKKLLDK